MKIQNLSTIVLALAIWAITTGCDRGVMLKTKLGEDERMTTRAPVFIDGIEAGYVKELTVEPA